MPNCISKPVSWKTCKCFSLAAIIKELGFFIMACFFCKCYSMGDCCKIMDGVIYCKECMHCSHSYNRMGVLLLAYKFIF
ncbi:hypothetical protein M441DRAFT_154106 [Trichoderma asperellum CBS 433.97]|uniref:Uncharacterized protein n=1 Tax=Trichoderma asperellum (strain ATCC 204424 / CBS 433.97 / NBRC 101777) TaxID=1042311 RepID=A0A2T3YRG1_TRIA4|nr:hypothetical protein M441DRAFT_154106 [Trichoderma asperellum CBS 433.97]PTB35155.1 hypothetical protein M441DRAFT_154106 [Trichoderma asperellum CBS 433.97]